MGTVHKFHTNMSADSVLEQAFGNYESVLIVGYDKCGDIDIRATSNIDRASLNWLIDKTKIEIMGLGEEE